MTKMICWLCEATCNYPNEVDENDAFLNITRVLSWTFQSNDVIFDEGIKFCNDCLKTTKSFYKFKLNCVENTEKTIQNYLEHTNKNGTEAPVKLLDVVKFTGEKLSPCNESLEFCRICLKLIEDASFYIITDDDTNGNNVLYIGMFKICIPEVDLDLTEDALACKKCGDFVFQMYEFRERVQNRQLLMTYADEGGSTSDVDIIEPETEVICISDEEDKATEEKKSRLNSVNKPLGTNVAGTSTNTTFICWQCNFQTNDKTKFYLHLTEKHNVNMGVDSKRSNSQNAYKKPVIFTCLICNFFTYSNEELVLHESKHKPFECSECNYQTKCKTELKRHIIQHHDPDFSLTKGYKHKSSVNYSDEGFDLEIRYFKCSHCSYESRWKGDVKKHSVAKHQSDYVDPVGYYKPKEKSETKTTVDTLTLESFKMFKCTYCSYKTRWKGDLKKHNSSKHSEENTDSNSMDYPLGNNDIEITESHFLMDDSNNSFNSNSMEISTDVSSDGMNFYSDRLKDEKKEITYHYCELCQYRTKWKHDLKKHMLNKHKTLDIYRCEVCPYKTKWKHDHKKHMIKKHDYNNDLTPKRVHKCTFCEYETKNSDELHKHVNENHPSDDGIMNESYFLCPICKCTRKDRSDMVRHIATQHFLEGDDLPEIPTVQSGKCKFCPYSTHIQSRLSFHMRYKHSDIVESVDDDDSNIGGNNNVSESLLDVSDSVIVVDVDDDALKKINRVRLNSEIKQKTINGIIYYYCMYCEYRTRWKGDLTKHIKRKHPDSE